MLFFFFLSSETFLAIVSLAFSISLLEPRSYLYEGNAILFDRTGRESRDVVNFSVVSKEREKEEREREKGLNFVELS